MKNSYKFLYKLDRNQGFQIIAQTNKIKRGDCECLFESNGWDFVSCDLPAISRFMRNTVYLRGNDTESDLKIVSPYELINMSDDEFSKLKQALSDFQTFVEQNY